MRTREEVKDEMFNINLKIIRIEQLKNISEELDYNIINILNDLKIKLGLLRKEMAIIIMSEKEKQK